jgi:DNA-binding CsgD family transcriptional regulator
MYGHMPDKPMLGARQLEILVHIALGSTYKQTAHALGISIHTVHASLGKILEKLGASGRAHAIALAFGKGLLNLEMLKGLAIPKELEASKEYGTLFEQVMTYLARGCMNKEIGIALGLTEQSVKNLVMSMSRALGARNRAHVVTLALVLGLLDPKNFAD